MKPDNGFELVRFSREMDARPGTYNFEPGSTDERLHQLGRRFFDISDHNTTELGHHRTFSHTFVSEDGIELSLEMGAYYSYEGKSEVNPDHAYHLWSFWKEGDSQLREERIYEEFEDRNDNNLEGDEIADMLNRLEESLIAAETVDAERPVAVV